MSQRSSKDYINLFQSVCQIHEATLLHAEETYGTNKKALNAPQACPPYGRGGHPRPQQ
jgi:hypothetical protein